MKKNVWLFGLAVAALSSCTQSEVLDVQENRQIRFESFVEKNSRVANDLYDTKGDNLLAYWVFGYYTKEFTSTPDFSGSNKKEVFDNMYMSRQSTQVPWVYEKTDNWVTNALYRFAAYSNGGTKVVNAAYDPATDELSFEDYTTYDKTDIDADANDAITNPLDLVASIPGDRNSSNQTEINFTLRHLLSKITIHFINKSNKADVEFNNIILTNIAKTGDCYCYFPGTLFRNGLTLPDGTTTRAGSFPKNVVWTELGTPGEFSYGDIEVRKGTSATSSDDLTFYVIPQSNQTSELTFDIRETITTDGDKKEYNTISDLSYSLTTNTHYTTTPEDVITNYWVPGFHYRYIVTIGSDFNDIQFAVTVNQWNKDRDGDGDPNGDGDVIDLTSTPTP